MHDVLSKRAHLITVNVYQRTFRIGFNNSFGTAFVVDVDGREYLVTARHLVAGVGTNPEVTIYWKGDWHRLRVRTVGEGIGDVDVAVLASGDMRLSPDLPLPPTSDGIALAQDVYFLGFPYNLFTEVGALNREFPLPFIKKATLSSMIKDAQGVHRIFLDGHNNPGFSGGPIVWTKPGKNSYKVAGVISGYRFAQEPIYDEDQPTQLAYRYNTGIIVAYGIEHALDLIKVNPIGFRLR